MRRRSFVDSKCRSAQTVRILIRVILSRDSDFCIIEDLEGGAPCAGEMSQPAAAAAAPAAAASDGPTEEEKAEGIAEVGWRLPAQWSDSTWRASACAIGATLAYRPSCAIHRAAAVRRDRRSRGAASAAEPGHADI